MREDTFKEALLESQRIYGLTEPISWFIRIHDELDMKRVRSREWLSQLVEQRIYDANEGVENSAARTAAEMEQEHVNLRLSTYLHEYCHFLQLASSPYYYYINSIQQYQTILVIRLCRELSQLIIELPLSEFIQQRAVNDHRYSVLYYKYIVPWESCERLMKVLEHSNQSDTSNPLQLYFQVNELLIGFNDQLRILTLRNTSLKKVLASLPQSYQPKLKDIYQTPTLKSEQTRRAAGIASFGGRAIAEASAAATQFLYIAATNGWNVESLKIMNTLFLDEYLPVIERICKNKKFSTLDRYTKFFTFYTLCDIALQSPLHPIYAGESHSDLQYGWDDLHPGERFCRAIDKIDGASIPEVSREEFESLVTSKSQKVTRILGKRIERFSRQICESLGWPSALELAKLTSQLASRSDDFITRLRVNASSLRMNPPHLLLIPMSPTTHAAFPPVGVFVGKEFLGSFAGQAAEISYRLINSYLLHSYSRQIMKCDHVDFYQQDSIIYSWLLSTKMMDKFQTLFHEVFEMDPKIYGEMV